MTDTSSLKPSKRMSVTLIPKANTELEWLEGHTQTKQVDVINRAVQIMGFIERQLDDGAELLLRGKDGQIEKINIL